MFALTSMSEPLITVIVESNRTKGNAMNHHEPSTSSTRITETHRGRARTCRTRALKGVRVAEWCSLILVILLLAIAAVIWSQGPAADVDTSRSIRVMPGDTLWSIAEANRLPGLSTSETAHVIRILNHMPASSLAAGDALLVPVPPGSKPLVAAR